MTEKKSLKDALRVRPADAFVDQGSASGDQPTRGQISKSTKRQKSKAPVERPIKVSFYWQMETERGLEEFRTKLLSKRRKLTRSQIIEALVKRGVKDERFLEELARTGT